MSLNRTSGRKLQILSEEYHESHQLDLLSFVSEHVAELSVKEKQPRVSSPKNATPKLVSYHCHGNVDSNKSISTFCVGKSNQFAVESIKRFISTQKTDFGMIFLKAPSGLGKSHLLHAVGNEMLRLKKSFYCNSPQLMSPIIDNFNMLKFYDILLIDDIEEIEGNHELQKTFCQLMDYATAGKIKLIIAGGKLPKDLNGCDDRTKGKLSAALVHHIDEMNNDLAYAIVETRSASLNLSLPDGVKRLVSNQVGFNVYGMESLLYKFKSSSDIKGHKITMEMALEEIKDKKVIYRTDEFHNLLSAVATAFQVSIEELTSSVRKKEFALARHVAMYVLKEKKGLGIMKIAELFERDHSSVVYAIARITKQLEIDLVMKNKIQSLSHSSI
jgi:chromosomal replication initiator protein